MQADQISPSPAPCAGRTTVFYDGACPMCRREIAHYRRLRGADRLCWIDIAGDPAPLADHGLDRAAAMARFHVLDRHGQWQTGAWGFAELWAQLPAYRWLAGTLRGLRLLPLLDLLYGRFARWRLQRRCDGGACDPYGY
jgi:predicted DCC family thiol-disulfide oxidoreductase YuxK